MIAWLLACAPDDREVVARVPVGSTADVEAVAALGDLWTELPLDHVDVRLPARHLDRLPDAIVLIDDLRDAVEVSRAGGGASFFEDWQTVESLDGYLDTLALRSPDAEVIEIGTSVEGRLVRGLSIETAGAADRPTLLVTGTQHAREWVAASSATWIADRLVTGTDPDATELLDRWRVVVVPVANPDGYRHTWTTDRMWRKNRRDNGDGTVGVDLNRNWDAAFGGAGASEVPSSNEYHGPSAFSEPETAALRDLQLDDPTIALHVDLHCTGQVALTSWGFTEVPAPDPELEGMAADAALAMIVEHGLPYRSGSIHDALYAASGVGIDWSYGVNGAAGFLLELRDRGEYGFLLPPDQIVPTAEEAWAGLLTVAASPPLRLALRVPTLQTGVPATVETARSAGGVAVVLFASTTGRGTTVVPGPLDLELQDARPVATGAADETGAASLTWTPEPALAGRTVWLQVLDGGTLSVPLETTVY
ncbi:MAG: hypothetical protein H6738_24245 [Alphaproteobacteria bacterium]|nr:hypothetical protein [Alphaproteobacteria bacterium]